MKYLKKFQTGSEIFVGVKPNVVLVNDTKEVLYNVDVDYAKIPLFVDAIDDVTISFSNTYEYSKDNATWDSGTSTTEITATAGERVFFRASGLTPNSSDGIGSFTILNGTCNVGGNVMSMAYGDDFKDKTEIVATKQFSKLFYNTPVIDASAMRLPATKLANHSYSLMFYGCVSLVSAPSLPATTLADHCYLSMFNRCASLVSAPSLPVTTLANYCYAYMFYGCVSLVSAPSLPATTLADYCYRQMFYGCVSLVSAPSLPATTLADYCYADMFNGCSKLNYVKAMFTTTPSSSYTSNWLSGVAATGTFVKNASATWDVRGVNGIPSGWTVETAEA